MTDSRRNPPAFTLLELVVVLMILSTAIALAAPAMSGWGRGTRLRDAGDQFLAVSRWARSQAIASSQVHRLNVDEQSGRFWVTVQEGTEFAPVASDLGREFFLPEGARIEMTNGQSEHLEFAQFYPTGRTSPRRVRLADDRGAIDIVCETPAEGFRILQPGEQVQ